MKRYAAVFAALVCLLAVPLAARESQEGLWFSRTDLVQTLRQAGGTVVEVYASPAVDVDSLLAEIDLAKVASPDAISERFNGRRRELYRDEEIILVVSPRPGTRSTRPGLAVDPKAAVVKAIYWWNNRNSAGDSWFAQYNGTTAVLFVAVFDGEYDIFRKIGSANYTYINFVSENETFVSYSVGGRTLRGFRGEAVTSTVGHIVLLFFK